MEAIQDELAVKYLLGKLNDEEQAAVETGYFQSTASFEDMLIAENSLIDAYVSDRLTPEDRVLFERRLLISPRQQQRAEFAGTFLNYASALPFEELRSSTSRSRWSTIFAGLFTYKPMLSYSLAATAFLFLATGVIWRTSSYYSGQPGQENLAMTDAPLETPTVAPVDIPGFDERTTVNETEKPATSSHTTGNAETATKPTKSLPEKRILARTKPRALVSTIILSLGSTRDSEIGRVFVIPEKTGLVNVNMKFDGGNFSSYFAILEAVDGRQIWNGKVAASNAQSGVATASLTVPAKRLVRGDYIVTLKGLTDARSYETVADYSFTIDRRK